MITLIKVLQLILALSVIVGFHEFGHFIFARLCGTRVDKFYLFFDVGGKRLFSTRHNKLFNKLFPNASKWQTDYGIGWLPLGGYCKIVGMIDESMDTSLIGKEPQPWELRAKKPWQRLLVMSGGVLFNFLLAVLLYVHILAIWGDWHLDNAETRMYAPEGTLAYELGFRSGDRVLALDGDEPVWFEEIQASVARHRIAVVTVLRGEDTLDIYMDGNRIGDLLKNPVFMPSPPFTISEVADSANAGRLLPGDHILAFEDTPIGYLHEGQDWLRAHPDTVVTASVLRGGDTLALPLQVSAEGRIGVIPASGPVPSARHLEYSYLGSYPAGIAKVWHTVSGYVLDLGLIFAPKTKAYKSVGSLGTMATIMPAVWDWEYFLTIVALLSVMLGVMNLLPIPALDGGHIVFTLYEMITRRKPSDRFMLVAQMIGMGLLLLLILVALGNDFVNLTS